MQTSASLLLAPEPGSLMRRRIAGMVIERTEHVSTYFGDGNQRRDETNTCGPGRTCRRIIHEGTPRVKNAG